MNNEKVLHRKGIKMPNISNYEIIKNAFYKKDNRPIVILG